MHATPAPERKKKGLPLILLYLGFGAALLAVLAWTSLRALQETPSRQASVWLPGQGWVTLTLTTDPSPPMPGGTVSLRVTAENDRGAMVDFGPTLPFRMGAQGSSQPLELGSLTFSPDGSGYAAGIQFPAPGDYWIDFAVGQGESVRFQVYVKPAQ